MKKIFYLVSVLVVLTLALGACGGSTATEAPTAEPPTAAPTEAPTEAVTEVAPVVTDAPAVVSVDLAGPPMEVGSKFLYVDGTILVAVPGGPFTMGYNFADNPEREVTVGDFWIYSTEVTNRQYALCVEAGKCTPPEPVNAPTFVDPNYVNFPITGVTHAQASDYCAFVKGHLPTEAQWEKTARGPEGNIFPWGDGAPTCSLTNYASCKGRTTAINDYPDGRSYYEAWDMGGNVREWVADWYDPIYNVENPVADPLGPELGEKRSVRSAGFTDSANATIAAHRFSLDPQQNLPDLGFRCVVEGDPSLIFAPWCEIIGYAGTNPDGTPGSCTPQVKCNDVSVTHAPNCSTQNTPYTIVTFEITNNPPEGATISIPADCTVLEESATGSKYQCLPPGGGGFATIIGTCTDAANCVSTCPVNYTKDGDKCVWNGGSYGGKECLPGSTFDPLTQCCTAAPGSAADLSLCPAGFYLLGGVCVPNPSTTPKLDQVNITFDSCTPPDDGGKDPDDPDEPGENPCPPGQELYCPVNTTYNAPCYCVPSNNP